MRTHTFHLSTLILWLGLAYVAVHGEQAAPAGDKRSVWDGVYTTEQATRGSALYAQHCASCHGSALGGLEAAPALTGIEFSSNWNGLTLGDLFERIRTSMPQDDPGKVSAQQKADILAHILSVGKLPPGMTELPRDAQVLAQIRYDTFKP